MFNLIRKFKNPKSEDYYLIFMKPWSSRLGISLEGKLNYMLVHTKDFKTFKIIDEPGEDDGFDSYRGAEQFLRAYLTNKYGKLPNRWYINKFSMDKDSDGYLINNKTGEKIEY